MNTPALASAAPAPSQEHRSHYVEDSHPSLGGPDGCAGAAASAITNAAITPTAKLAPSAPRKNQNPDRSGRFANLLHGWANPIGGVQGFGPYATLATAAGLGWLTSLFLIDAVISPAGAGLVYIGTSSPLAFIFANLLVYFAGFSTVFWLEVLIVLGFIAFAIYQARLPKARRTILDIRAALWVLPSLAGLLLLSWLGRAQHPAPPAHQRSRGGRRDRGVRGTGKVARLIPAGGAGRSRRSGPPRPFR
jgi:hypothetical protein